MTARASRNLASAASNRNSRKRHSSPDEESDQLEVVSLNSEDADAKEYIGKPRDLDICCGRGKGFFTHPGNKIFQNSVKDNLQRYTHAPSKNRKSEVVSNMVQELYLQGLRFVKRDPEASNRWFVLSSALAHEKAGHAIRDCLMQRRRQQHSEDSKEANIASKESVGLPISNKKGSKSKQAIKKKIATTSKKTKRSATKKSSPAPRDIVLSSRVGKHQQATPSNLEIRLAETTELDIVSITSSSAADEVDIFDDFTMEPVGRPQTSSSGLSGMQRTVSDTSTTLDEISRLFGRQGVALLSQSNAFDLSEQLDHAVSLMQKPIVEDFTTFPYDQPDFGHSSSEEPLTPNKVLLDDGMIHPSEFFSQNGFMSHADTPFETTLFEASTSDGMFGDSMPSSTRDANLAMMHRDLSTWNNQNFVIPFLPKDDWF